jgi:hypothetical protein
MQNENQCLTQIKQSLSAKGVVHIIGIWVSRCAVPSRKIITHAKRAHATFRQLFFFNAPPSN